MSLWLLLGRDSGAAKRVSSAKVEEARAAESRPVRLARTAAAAKGSSVDAPRGAATRVAEHQHDAAEGSHPITPERLRIQHELQLISMLNDATDLGNVAQLRTLLDVYRREHRGDPHKMQQGYGIIADCLEFPGSASREAAQRFYDTERASTLRRYIRRTCFERDAG